jgi:hypothetical protein
MNDSRRPCYPKFYNPLGPEFTRVFELEPGEFSDPIVGQLVSQAICGQPYEAVSYVWGDPQKRRDIIIDGAPLSVPESLYGALTAFRHRPLSGSSDDPNPDTGPVQGQVRRLWVDAVCINQEDMPERISQVEQMARIYASARRVLAWLGWEEGEEGRLHTQSAIRFIHSFMEDPESDLRDARILLHHDLADPARHLALLSEDERRRFEEQLSQWEAVKSFFEIEYFHRTWIVQELGLAREAVMYSALKPADEAKTDKEIGVGEAADRRDSHLELDFVDWPLVGRFAKLLDYSGASLVAHLDLQSWVAHHILMVWETKEDGTPDCDFLTSMHWSRILRVSDARDRVYGLLGHPMAVVDGSLVIKPDYTHTRGVIYTKLAANFIRATKSLYAVSLVDHEEDPSVEAREWDSRDESRMPSWVPDWHSTNRTTPLDYPNAAAEIEDSDIRIEGDISGVEGAPLPHLLVRGWVVDEIVAVSRRMETTDFPIAHLARERAKENPFWLDRLWELVFPADGPSDRDALEVLESLSLALPQGTREKGEMVSKVAGSNQTLVEHHRSFAAYVLEYHRLWRSAPETSGIDGDSYLPTCSLFDSLPAAAQTELRRRAKGGTSRGFIECMTWASMCRVVYRTMSGLVGMGSRISRPGDLVCRVRGMHVLMTVRRIGLPNTTHGTTTGISIGASASISCAHIGPTVVPARMKRGLVDGWQFGEKAAHFRIV